MTEEELMYEREEREYMLEQELEKDNEELLYNQLYEKTKDCGRTQFVRLLMEKERENKHLKEQLQQKEDIINKAIKFVKDYKNEWVLNDEVLNDMNKLLEILDNKGSDK